MNRASYVNFISAHMRPRNVLVTGGTGFIGQHLVRALLLRGDTVHVIARTPERIRPFVEDGKVFVHPIDLWDGEAVRKLYTLIAPEEIYHLASSVLQWGSTEGLETLTRVNVLGTAVLMEALEVIPKARFVYASSYVEVGGKNEPVREDHCPDPQEFYAISKLAGTLEGRHLARNKGYNIIIGRFFTVYGPGTPKGRLIEQIVTRALKNEEITLTHKEISRDFVYVSDAVACIMELGRRAEELRGEIFNIASGAKTTLQELMGLVRELTQTSSKVAWHPEKRTAYEALPWQADMTKTYRVLTWRPEVRLREGLTKTIDWAKDKELKGADH